MSPPTKTLLEKSAYDVAPVPTGWAYTAHLEYRTGGFGAPWCGRYPTRDEAEQAARAELAAAIDRHNRERDDPGLADLASQVEAARNTDPLF